MAHKHKGVFLFCLPSEELSEFRACLKGVNDFRSLSEKLRSFFDDPERDPFCFMPRIHAEQDERYLQLIPYVVLRYAGDKYLVYKRAGSETRLHALWSIGVGGHVELSDYERANHDPVATVFESCERELAEELGFSFSFREHAQALNGARIIYSRATPVSRVHLGLVLLLDLSKLPDDTVPSFSGSEELGTQVQFLNPQELQDKCDALPLEDWSAIVVRSGLLY